eukprot:4050774-Prymnesium_polylepis.1
MLRTRRAAMWRARGATFPRRWRCDGAPSRKPHPTVALAGPWHEREPSHVGVAPTRVSRDPAAGSRSADGPSRT